MRIDPAAKRTIDEMPVRNFFAAGDPEWRWALSVAVIAALLIVRIAFG